MSSLDQRWVRLPAIVQRLREEAGFAPWWAASTIDDDKVLSFGECQTRPEQAQQMFARDMAWALNKHLHHDGRWIVQWVEPAASPVVLLTGTRYGKCLMIWMDGDGDIQFPIEMEEPFEVIAAAGPDPWMEHAERGWWTWKNLQSALDLRPHETYKRALGEAAPSGLQ